MIYNESKGVRTAFMKNLNLTKAQARRFMLACQGLLPPYGLKGKDGVLAYIRRVGCIQYDPLNIVGRNPELVLQARVSDFRPEMLETLLYEDRSLLDGWDKMMCIYSTADWPFFGRVREAAERRYGKSGGAVAAVLPQVREAIRKSGPLSSIDLKIDEVVDWAWAPTRVARAALESMYWWGELVVHHRVNTRRLYDFAHRHIPEALLAAAEPNKTEKQYQAWRVLRRIGGVGLIWGKAGDAWIGISGVKSKERGEAISGLLKKKQIVEVLVEDIKYPLYLRQEDVPLLEAVMGGESSLTQPQTAVFLAPLDNLLWDRQLIKEIFDFEYRWEVYKPAEERKYGYYVLPVLYGDRFVARFEPAKDKKTKTLIIRNWWWEEGVEQSEPMREGINAGLRRFMEFLGCCRVQLPEHVFGK